MLLDTNQQLFCIFKPLGAYSKPVLQSWIPTGTGNNVNEWRGLYISVLNKWNCLLPLWRHTLEKHKSPLVCFLLSTFHKAMTNNNNYYIRCLLCARHCFMSSTYINLVNHYNNSMGQVSLLSPFYRWGNWVTESNC